LERYPLRWVRDSYLRIGSAVPRTSSAGSPNLQPRSRPGLFLCGRCRYYLDNVAYPSGRVRLAMSPYQSLNAALRRLPANGATTTMMCWRVALSWAAFSKSQPRRMGALGCGRAVTTATSNARHTATSRRICQSERRHFAIRRMPRGLFGARSTQCAAQRPLWDSTAVPRRLGNFRGHRQSPEKKDFIEVDRKWLALARECKCNSKKPPMRRSHRPRRKR
jgi:hypothetical protein